VAAGPVAA